MARPLRVTNRASNETSAWTALQSHHKTVSKLHLRQLFDDDPKRGERMTAEAAGIYLDYSKNRITDKTLDLLHQLAEQRGLRSKIEAMVRGDQITIIEHHAVLHVALLPPQNPTLIRHG